MLFSQNAHGITLAAALIKILLETRSQEKGESSSPFTKMTKTSSSDTLNNNSDSHSNKHSSKPISVPSGSTQEVTEKQQPAVKPVPAPRKCNMVPKTQVRPSAKKRLTVFGNSIVRNMGSSVKQNTTDYDSCVLSHSGLGLTPALDMISRVISGHTQQDTLVMHLGTTDIEQYDVGKFA